VAKQKDYFCRIKDLSRFDRITYKRRSKLKSDWEKL